MARKIHVTKAQLDECLRRAMNEEEVNLDIKRQDNETLDQAARRTFNDARKAGVSINNTNVKGVIDQKDINNSIFENTNKYTKKQLKSLIS